MFSLLKREEEFDYSLEEQSLFTYSVGDDEEVDVTNNPKIPVEYFDSFIIGLTATPSAQTFCYFNHSLVMEYGYSRAVADGVNVGYEIYEIKTKISEEGLELESGRWVYKRNKETRQQRWSYMDEDIEYSPSQLDRAVVSKSQIRTIIRTFKEKLFTEIFPGIEEMPKT